MASTEQLEAVQEAIAVLVEQAESILDERGVPPYQNWGEYEREALEVPRRLARVFELDVTNIRFAHPEHWGGRRAQ